jgi:DNA-binding MarR family transcriptional regulator
MNAHHLTQTDYQSLAEFRYQIRRFLRFSEDAARDAGIEPQHHQLMLAIKGKPATEEPRIAYVAERLQIQHHSAVELVNRLAKRGLVARGRNARDRREVLLKLTPRGERVLAELTMHTSAELRSAAPALVGILRKLARPGRAGSRTRRPAVSAGAAGEQRGRADRKVGR